MGYFDDKLIGAFALGMVILFVIVRMFYAPLKAVLKLAINSVCGGLIMCVVNIAGSLFGIHIGINVFTALVAGVLGIPGIAFMLLAQIVLGSS